jgi:hypothetical protein
MARVTTQKERSSNHMKSAMGRNSCCAYAQYQPHNLVECTELMRSHTPQKLDESYMPAETRLSREMQPHIVQIRVPI